MDLWTSLCSVLLLVLLASASSQDPDLIIVPPGQDAILQCDGPKDSTITLLEWVRPDLTSDGYVFFYRDEHLYENYLHPSFVGRVELRDPKMKDGNVSVVLKNVTSTDTGTYECSVSVSKASRRTRAAADFSKTIKLLVKDSGSPAGQIGPGRGDVRKRVALVLPFIGAVALVVGIIIKRQNSRRCSDEELCAEQV